MTQATRDADDVGNSSVVAAREQPPAHVPAAERGGTSASQVTPADTRLAAAKRLCAWAPALATALLLAYAVRGGMPAGNVALATFVVLVTQVLPGVLVWRTVRPRDGWWVEDLAIGFAIGSVLAIGAQVIAGLSQQYWIAWSPVLVAVVLVAVPATRVRILTVSTQSLPWWWGPTVGALFFLCLPQLRGYFRQVPLSWTSGARTPHIDAYLHLALSAQLARRGPTTFPWVKSEALGYHWFSHAWVAQVSVASGVELDQVLFRFMAVLMPAVVLLAIAIGAVRLTGRAWTGPAAVALATIGGDLNLVGKLTPGAPISPLSPSLSLSIPMLVGIVVVLALSWNGRLRSGGILLLPLLCLGAAGTKGSTLPLIVVGLGLAIAAMLIFNRERALRVFGDLVVVVACLILALVFVFHGSDAGLHYSLSDAADQTPAKGWLGTPHNTWERAVALGFAAGGVVARGAGALALPFARTGRRSPLVWLLIGGSLAGAGAVAVFAHPGLSQWYFARTAEPLLAFGSVMGLVALFKVIDPARRLPLVGLGLIAGAVMVFVGPALVGPLGPGTWRRAVAMILLACFVVVVAGAIAWFAGSDRTERVRLAGAAVVLTILLGGIVSAWSALVAPPPAPLKNVSLDRGGAVSEGEIAAARWIRDHSGVNDLVMTNRHCTTPKDPTSGCDSRRFVVAAFSERQVLVEGWTATPESAKLGPHGRDSITVAYWKPDLLALNDGFIAHPTEDAAKALRADGVKWIYVDHTRPYAATLEPYATLRYQAPGVDVYEFTGTG